MEEIVEPGMLCPVCGGKEIESRQDGTYCCHSIVFDGLEERECLMEWQVSVLPQITFDEYQQATGEVQMESAKGLSYLTLGLTGEAGEVANKAKKVIRDKGGVIDEEVCNDMKGELGDVLWYLARLSDLFGFRLETIALENVKKLRDRKARGVLSGSGDNR